jgi:hypothetical protein
MLKDMLMNILMTGAGATVLVMLVKYFVPKDKLGQMCLDAGRAASALGNKKWGKVFYEPLEAYFQDLLKFSVDKFAEGLDADDQEAPK